MQQEPRRFSKLIYTSHRRIFWGGGLGWVQRGATPPSISYNPRNKMFTHPKIFLTPLIFGIINKESTRTRIVSMIQNKSRRTLKLKRQSNALKLIAPRFHPLVCLSNYKVLKLLCPQNSVGDLSHE